MESFKAHLSHAMEQFSATGKVELYKIIFGTPPFPFWFTINCLWSCHVVHLSTVVRRRKHFVNDLVTSFAASFLMTFAPKEALAFVMKKGSPIAARPLTLAIHALVFVLYEFSPGELFYRLMSFCCYFLGLLEGMYQMKTLTFCLRNIRITRGFGVLVCAVFWTTLDQVIESMFRAGRGGRRTWVTGIWFWIRSVVVYSTYWMLTHEHQWTDYLGLRSIVPMALVFCGIQGLLNAHGLIMSRQRSDKCKKD